MQRFARNDHHYKGDIHFNIWKERSNGTVSMYGHEYETNVGYN